jgi:hypothetical protein
MLSSAGHSVRILDINARIYRYLLDLPLPPLLAKCGRLALRESFTRAFFLGKHIKSSDLQLVSEARGLERPVLSAFAMGEFDELERHRQDAIRRMTGVVPFAGHVQYVVDQEFLNAILDLRVKTYDSDASLSLEGFTMSEDICSSESLFSYFGQPGNLIERLANDSSEGLLEDHFEAVFIRVGCHAQLAGALAVAGWLKRRKIGQVVLTGGILDNLSSCGLYDFDSVVDIVIPFELSSAIQNFILKQEAHTRVGTDIQVSKCVTGSCSDYLTPLAIASVQATTGCYWSRCAFCSVPASSGRYNSTSASSLLAVFGTLAEAGTKGIQFFDYALPFPVLSTLAGLGARGPHWAGQVRFENFLLNKHLLSNLYRSGCTSLSFGFESGSPRLLAQMDKGGSIDNSDRMKILRKSAEAGIRNHLFLISGLPGETEEDFLATVGFLDSAQEWIHSIEVHPFQLHPGSIISRSPDRFKISPSPSRGELRMMSEYDGLPSSTISRARAEALEETFGWLSARSAMNDWLEGHIPLLRYLL